MVAVKTLVLFAVAACSSLSAAILALPAACGPSTLKTYIDNGSSGCSLDPFTYKSFTFNRLTAVGAGENINENTIQVVPTGDASSPLNFLFGDVTLVGQEKVIFQISYIIDPPPPIVPGFDMEMYLESPKNGGKAIISTDLCANGLFFRQGCTEGGEFRTLSVFYITDTTGVVAQQLKDSVTFTPTNIVSIRQTIELSANGGSAQIDGFGNRITVTPEPGAFALVAGGLAGLVFLRRRR